MKWEVLQPLLNYIESQHCAVQITLFSGPVNNREEVVVDFESKTHAVVCLSELVDQDFAVCKLPDYYARLA